MKLSGFLYPRLIEVLYSLYFTIPVPIMFIFAHIFPFQIFLCVLFFPFVFCNCLLTFEANYDTPRKKIREFFSATVVKFWYYMVSNLAFHFDVKHFSNKTMKQKILLTKRMHSRVTVCTLKCNNCLHVT